MIGWIVAALAWAAGVTQAGLLRRSVRLGPDPIGFVVRLSLVGSAMTIAAAAGWLGTGAAAWSLGFAGSTIVLAWRSR